MGNKYYHISYRIDLGSQTPIYGQELISMSPLRYVLYWKDIGGDYGNRVILYSNEITEEEYYTYRELINEE